MLRTAAEKTGLIRAYETMGIRVSVASDQQYSLRDYGLLFFLYSIVGWIWEVLLFMALQQEFINTGLLHGPWLPIYGVGGVAVLELFKNIRHDPAKTFIAIMVVAGIVEYATHAATERIFGMTWWDYSDYIFNINGRICIEGLVAFGILGCFSVYFITPKVKCFVENLNIKTQNCLIVVLGAAFILDTVQSLISPNCQNIYF